LQQYQQRQKAAQGRLTQLEKDEAALSNVIAGLERRRRDEESRSGGAVVGTLTTRDLGALNWPVEGNLVFRFGPDRRDNGVVLRYNGIGIAAPVGTPVKAVEAGSVQIAGPLEGYGQAVVISHGAGAYTLYFRLQRVMVQVGQAVTAGQMIGTVGGSGSEHGPHLEFQVRVPTNGTPTPVDPLDWLRSRPTIR
jgi:septal ring factor EnvC (AmiA/AmiB activator)